MAAERRLVGFWAGGLLFERALQLLEYRLLLRLSAVQFKTVVAEAPRMAAIFSLTNNTVLFETNSSAMVFAIVWDFPVPGGPSTTRLFFAFMSSITAIGDGSASNT